MSIKPAQLKPPAGATINWSDPLARGLVGDWLFNRPDKTIPNLANPGIGEMVGTSVDAADFAIGPGGHYVTLDGSADYFMCAGAPALFDSGDPPYISVELVIRHNTSGDSPISFQGSGASNKGWNIFIDTDTKPGGFEINAKDDGNTSAKLTGATDWRNQGWVHMVAVINGYDRTDWRIYVNGQDDSGTEAGSDLTQGLTQSTHGPEIGSMRNGVFLTPGDFSRARIWTRALTAADVRALYTHPFRIYRHPVRIGVASVAGAPAGGPEAELHRVRKVLLARRAISVGLDTALTYNIVGPEAELARLRKALLARRTTSHGLDADITHSTTLEDAAAVLARTRQQLLARKARSYGLDADLTYDAGAVETGLWLHRTRQALLARSVRTESLSANLTYTAWVLDQFAYRFRTDDGTEATATWEAALNTDVTISTDSNARIRFLVKETAGVPSANTEFRLQYNHMSAGWVDCSQGSNVIRITQGQLVDAADTTQQLGAGTFVTPNRGQDEINGQAGGAGDCDFAGNDEVELEFCFQVRSVDVGDLETIQLRLVQVTSTGFEVLQSYSQTPTITASKPAGVPSTRTAALINRAAITTIGIHVQATNPSVDHYWGTAALRHLVDTAETTKYTPALDAFGAVVTDGSPGIPSAISDVTFSVANKVLGMYGASPQEIGATLYGNALEGANVTVRAFVESPGGVWEEFVIFAGVIGEVAITETSVEFRAGPAIVEEFEAPNENVEAGSMTYNSVEGEEPEEFGRPAPLAYGRMGMQAISADHDANDAPWGVGRGFVLAPSLGIKVPMVPVEMLADLHQQRLGVGVFSNSRHVLYTLGSTHIGAGLQSKALPWWQPDPEAPVGYTRGLGPVMGNPLFPAERTSGSQLRATMTQSIKYGFLFTWSASSGTALPYCKDFSDDQDDPPHFDGEHENASLWDYFQTKGAGEHTGNTGQSTRHHVWALARLDPDWTDVDPSALGAKWTGMAQSVFVLAEKLTTDYTATGGLIWQTDGPVFNAQAAFDGKADTFAFIPNNTRLAVQFPAEVPRQNGTPLAARVGILTGPGSVGYKMSFRYTPFKLLDHNEVGEWNIIDSLVTSSQVASETAVNEDPFATFYIWNRNDYTTEAEFEEGKRPRWKTTELHKTSNSEWAHDLVIHSDVGTTTIVYAVWLEIIFTPKPIEPLQPKIIVVDQGRVDSGEDRFQRQPNPLHNPGAGNVVQQDDARQSKTFATGVWGLDVTGQYGPNAPNPIENPVSIVLHSIDYFLGEYLNVEFGVGAFGGFLDAIDELDNLISGANWRLAVIQTQRTTMRQFHDEVMRHAMGFVRRQVDVDNTVRWRAFIDTTSPPAARMWRNDTELTPNDAVPGSVRVTRTPKAVLRTDYVLKYGLHLPTGTYAYRHTCSPHDSSLTSQASAYVSACSTTSSDHNGLRRSVTFELPWLWQHKAAEEVLKWHIDGLRQARVGITLTCDHNLLDIQVGNFVRLSDDWSTYLGPYAGKVTEDGTAWSGHKFAVVGKTVRYSGDSIVVDLALLERWVRPAGA